MEHEIKSSSNQISRKKFYLGCMTEVSDIIKEPALLCSS